MYQCSHYRHGKRCLWRTTRNNHSFCSMHRYSNPSIHILIKAALKGKQEWSWKLEDIFEVIKALNGRSTSRFNSILNNLFTHIQILQVSSLYNLPYLPPNRPKWLNVKTITEFFHTLYLFSMNNSTSTSTSTSPIGSLIWCQQRMRARKARHMKFMRSRVVNDEDPFTLNKISDIDPIRIFMYEDSHACVYAFDLPFLYHACASLGAWNPFNREPFSQPDIDRMQRAYYRLPHILRTVQDEHRVETVQSAVVDLLTLFDAEGFYTDMRWFDNLTSTDVWQFWHFFNTSARPSRLYTQAFEPHKLTMDILLRGDDYTVKYMIASMKTAFLEGGVHRFNITCNILVTMGEVRANVRRALPEWVYLAC